MKDKIMYGEKGSYKFVSGLEGFVAKDGRFWGNDEHMAKWSSCTHMICECGNEHSKGWTCCEACRAKHSTERFNKLEKKAWDGKLPLCAYDDDKYFFDYESIDEHCEENGIAIEDLQLVICKPVGVRTLDSEYFTEDLHEDAGLSPEVEALIEKINAAVSDMGTACWEPDKYAAII